MLFLTGSMFLVFALLMFHDVQGHGHHKSKRQVAADKELSLLINKLWLMDKNRISLDSSIQLSLQGHVPWHSNGVDAANYPLFGNVNNNFMSKPTFRAFVSLLNNYYRTTGTKESISNSEISENYNFLNLVLNTPIMKEVYAYLKKKGKASSVYSQFKQKLYDLWFRSYYRSYQDRVPDSSGFEHVFVGEVNKYTKKVTGFHNWLQFYLEEKDGNVNYMGYLKKHSRNKHLLMMRFKWHDKIKTIGSFFMGTSPEFEFALYSLVYLLGNSEVTFTLDGMNVKMTCHGINKNRSIGSCYPDLL